METFFPFSKPFISEAAIAEVVDSLRSGWITTGPKVKRFETMLTEYLHTPHALCLTSGTAGLQLAIKSMGIGPGDEVIVPAFTFVASLNTVVINGATPVLVDIDHDTRLMDVTLIEKAITPKTRAIMPVHFGGVSCDLDPIYALAKKHGLRVIEDAAQAIGAVYKKRLIGSFGDTHVFSFHPNKNMTTGEGGCVTTQDDVLAKKIAVLRFHGIDRDAFNRFTKAGSQEYDVIEPGFKYNMLDIQAALGLHQLPMLPQFNKRRHLLAMRYHAALADVTALSLPGTPSYDCEHTWHLYTVLIDPKIMSRDAFIARMKDKNIGIGLHYQATHLFTLYRERFGYKEGDFPVTELVANRIVSLPLFPAMTEDEQDDIIATIKDVLGNP